MSDGNYVDVAASTILPTPDAPWTTVTDRFAETLALATQMQELLVGADGTAGYLGAFADTIEARPTFTITAPVVDTSLTLVSSGAKPTFDYDLLVDVPNDTYTAPTMTALPAIDDSGLAPGTLPDEATYTFTWTESTLPTDLYDDLLARLQADLTAGATGLDATVEAAILSRGQARQQAANLKAYNDLNADLVSRGFQMPSGSLTAALAEMTTEGLRQTTEVNNQIIITSADLAQKNSQFVIQQSVALEGVIRQSKDSKDKNALEYAKGVVEFILKKYEENIKRYTAGEEAKKTYVQAQAENLRAVVESNKGAVEIYKAQYEGLTARIEGATKQNEDVTRVFLADMQGYSEGKRADASDNSTLIEHLKAKILYADMQVRAATASAEQSVAGYVSENQVREKLHNDMAQIAAQTIASSLNAVNASAGISYSGSESKSESWNHSESISEQHEYQHDPVE